MITQANWITQKFEIKDEAVEFVYDFTAKKEVKSAKISITAIGVYEAHLNGKRIGNFIFAPGCTAYNKRLQYQVYDITDIMAESNNIVVAVGNGWHRGRISANRKDINAKPCAIIADIEIIYTDGTNEHIYTDESWYARKSKIIANDLWDGETYDASAKTADLQGTEIVDLDKDILILQEGEIVCEHERIVPKQLIITPKGEKVIDFGQNITGYVSFCVNAKKGDRIKMSCAEVLDKDGNFYNANYRSAKAAITYICKDGKQEYKPHFAFYGFRYIRLDEYAGEIDLNNFCAIAVYADIKRTGYIRTSNQKLNQLFSNTLWSQRDNFLDIPTDCPQRDERMGWTGDAQVFVKTACYNYDVKKFFEKWLGDLRAEQRENGSVPDTVPNFWNLKGASTAWGDVINIIAWRLYTMYGDKKDLEDNYDAMKKWVDYMTNDSIDKYLWTCNENECKLWGKHYGDWLALDAPLGSYRGSTSDNFIASAFYAYSTQLLIKAGNVLGKDMAEYEDLYENIVSTFKKTFSKLTTQTEHVLALYFNLTDDKEKAAKSLNEMIKNNGYKLQTGFVGTPYLLYALSENGYADTAYKLLLQEEYPSWLYEVNHGATTIWEHWDGVKEDGTFWSDDMNSYNHYAYGSVIDWIYSVAGGIKPDNECVGFERVVIEPVPSKQIDWLEAEYNSIGGKIVSKWTNTDGGTKYEIKTPVAAKIIISGKEYNVGAGEYVFYGE